MHNKSKDKTELGRAGKTQWYPVNRIKNQKGGKTQRQEADTDIRQGVNTFENETGKQTDRHKGGNKCFSLGELTL